MTVCYGVIFLMWCDPAPPPAPPPAITVCPPLPQWSQIYQGKLVDELERLPNGSSIKEALREYVKLREQIRRCKAKD